MKAIILAAGLGKRLRGTTDSPKCLLPLAGKRLIDHQLDALRRYGIDEVYAILGYRREEIDAALPQWVHRRAYADYASTNNLWTLASCADLLDGPCLVLFADVRFSASALGDLLRDTSEISVLADGRRCLAGTMRVRAVDIGSHIPASDGDGNFIGIAKVGGRAALALRERLRQRVAAREGVQDYYTTVLPEIARTLPATVQWMGGRPWVEIDDAADLQRAHAMPFADQA
jgi:L-glutamine-phosphate cytidylyltransferase